MSNDFIFVFIVIKVINNYNFYFDLTYIYCNEVDLD
jgi:hypothetical protein